MEIKDSNVIITGGGTGIGAAIAADLCGSGARAMIAGRREEKLIETADAIRAKGGEISYRSTNIGDPDECTALVQAAVDAYGPVDVLINNAGVLCHGKSIEDHTVEEWDTTMNINLRAAFLLTCAVLPSMRERRRGFILMVSSNSGTEHFPEQVIYGLSKHGMNDLVQYIMAEYNQYNIHAATLCPGLTDTEMGLSFNPAAPQNVLQTEAVAAWAKWVISQPDNMKTHKPLELAVMWDPMKES